jgi:hypothetical protein
VKKKNKEEEERAVRESVVNFSGWEVFSKESDHNALFHSLWYLLFTHHSSNSRTGLNRF